VVVVDTPRNPSAGGLDTDFDAFTNFSKGKDGRTLGSGGTLVALVRHPFPGFRSERLMVEEGKRSKKWPLHINVSGSRAMGHFSRLDITAVEWPELDHSSRAKIDIDSGGGCHRDLAARSSGRGV
jgi:hypothetical protein